MSKASLLFKEKCFFPVLDTMKGVCKKGGFSKPPFMLLGEHTNTNEEKHNVLCFALTRTFNREHTDPYWKYFYIGCKPIFFENNGNVILSKESEWWYSIGYGSGAFSTPKSPNAFDGDFVEPVVITGDIVKFIKTRMEGIIQEFKRSTPLEEADGEEYTF